MKLSRRAFTELAAKLGPTSLFLGIQLLSSHGFGASLNANSFNPLTPEQQGVVCEPAFLIQMIIQKQQQSYIIKCYRHQPPRKQLQQVKAYGGRGRYLSSPTAINLGSSS